MLLGARADADDIELAGNGGSFSIDPATLAVVAHPSDGPAIPVAAAQTGLGTVTNQTQTAQSAQWELPERQLTVAVKLDGAALDVSFAARKAGEIAWPTVPAASEIQGYVLPLAEGVYAPVADGLWRHFLVQRGALTTTADLSMPFWGLDCGKHTVTYLLTNAYNNELVFHEEGTLLSAQLTHSFLPNQTVKTYGVRITLGGPSVVESARVYRNWLIQQGQFVSLTEKIRRVPDTAKLLGAAHIYLWGDGFAPEMIDELAANGFTRLWLGSPDWEAPRKYPTTISKAKAAGYLVGLYDSYDAVHSPDAKPDDTWETAQFDCALYETGAIQRRDGSKVSGFERKGYMLNALAARPYLEKRVTRLLRSFPCNSWFMDCDAFGDLYDDFSRTHPMTQEQDAAERLRRMAWIRDTFHVVVGSEGGSAYAASTIAFAHGMTTPTFGWGDKDLKDHDSPYFLGAYYPPTGPAVFFRSVPLKPSYERFYFDPRFRLPLYETAFHDSVITTNHWTMPDLKFTDQVTTRALRELLYGVPPLYHLNRKEFAARKTWLKAYYAFFSPLHREVGALPLTDFAYLTSDRLVQRTVFGTSVEVVANFGRSSFIYRGHPLPPASVLALHRADGTVRVFTPKTLPAGR